MFKVFPMELKGEKKKQQVKELSDFQICLWTEATIPVNYVMPTQNWH